MILENQINLKRIDVALNPELEFSETELQKWDFYVQELQKQKPIQYLLGKTEFFGLEFFVNQHTLIPRPETEELVDLIIKENKSESGPHIIDIGTGSGCIAISLKTNLPLAEVSAVDISNEAISIARENAKNNNCFVDFRCLDILEWDHVFDEKETFDVIVSNPPYITQEEKNDMHRNVLQFEPHVALFVEDSAPLLFYDHISSFALKHLNKEGTLYFEINQYLAKETQELLLKKGFSEVLVFKDINAVSRMIKAKF